MSGNVTSGVMFLVDTLLSLYAMVVLLRFLLQMVRADFYNPLSQFVVRATNPLLMPLRRPLPTIRGFNTAAAVVAWILASISERKKGRLRRRPLAPATVHNPHGKRPHRLPVSILTASGAGVLTVRGVLRRLRRRPEPVLVVGAQREVRGPDDLEAMRHRLVTAHLGMALSVAAVFYLNQREVQLAFAYEPQVEPELYE